MKRRIEWLDSARAIAILLVVFTHAHERAGNVPYYINSIFYSIDRVGVPIFFMISGGLLIPKLSNVDILNFYKKKIPKFILLLVFYTIITNAIYFITTGNGFFNSLSQSAINYNGIFNTSEKYGEYGYARQMWFMYSIIGIYLIAPFLSKLILNSKTKDVLIFISICIALNQLRLTLEYYFGKISSFDRIGVEMTGSYLSYFIIGHLIINKMDVVKYSYKSLVFFATTPAALLLFAEIKSGDISWPMHWYSGSVYILISSIAVMLIIKKYFLGKDVKFLSFLSKYSFGIYLSHYAIIYIVVKMLNETDFESHYRLIILFLSTVIISSAYCFLVSKNKLLSRFLM